MDSKRNIFNLDDLHPDMQGEVFSHFSSLPVRDLLQARLVNKKLLKAATTALFYKKNTSALFAKTSLVKRAFTGESTVDVTQQQLQRSLKRASHSLTQQMIILSSMAKQQGVDLVLPAAIHKGFTIPLRIFCPGVISPLAPGSLLPWLNMELEVVFNGISGLNYFSIIMRMKGRDTGFDFTRATNVLHLVISELDQFQLPILLESLRLLAIGTWEAKANDRFWEQNWANLLRPLVRDIALKLEEGVVASYLLFIKGSLLDFSYFNEMNLIILEYFASKIDDKFTDEILKSLKDYFLSNSHIEPRQQVLILDVIAAYARFNIIKDDLRESWLALIKNLRDNTKSPDVLSAAQRAIQALMSDVKGALVQYPDEWEPPPDELELSDKWLLACEDRLTVTDREKRLDVVLIYLQKQIEEWPLMPEVTNLDLEKKEAVSKKIATRIQRMATLFSPENARDCLAFALVFLVKQLRHLVDEQLMLRFSPLQALVAQMSSDDLKSELTNIIETIPKDYVNTPESISLISYFIVNGICSLEEIKAMKPFSERLTKDALLLLETASEWHLTVEAAQVNRQMPRPS